MLSLLLTTVIYSCAKKRTRSKIKWRVDKQWASEINQINTKVVFLKNKVQKGLTTFQWSLCFEKLRQLIDLFYKHCIDNVPLNLYKELFAYGHKYYFKNLPLETLNDFLDGFPNFPTHQEWEQYVAISILCRKMVAFWFRRIYKVKKHYLA